MNSRSNVSPNYVVLPVIQSVHGDMLTFGVDTRGGEGAGCCGGYPMRRINTGLIALWFGAFGTIPDVVLGDDIQVFDTEGYLDACTSRIQNFSLHVLMNGLCISTAVKFCDLSLGADQLGKCLPTVVDWLQKDVQRIQASIPAAEKLTEHSIDLFADTPIDTGDVECNAVDVTGVSVEDVCNYQEAVLGWQKHRIIELSQ